MELNEILRYAVEREASDIHLKVGRPPTIRVHRRLRTLDHFPKLTIDDIEDFIDEVVKSPKKRQILESEGQLDISYSIPKLTRFRVNIYRQRTTYAFAFRVIKTEIKDIEELMLPKKLYDIALEPRGLVLVTGPTGSGKSTTLAAMIDYRNRNKDDVIITIEDPIEYLFSDKNCYIVQREVGIDAEEFSSALKAALREDPDVIMVGEMRDIETIETALRAAETGHLVFSTLHTNDAKETINRIIDMFPYESQRQVRILLSTTLKAVISQRLIPRSDGKGVVPAVEVLINAGAIRDAILDPEKFAMINEYIEKGRQQYGMQSFDQAILDLYNRGLISYKDALTYATNPTDVELKIKGIRSENFGEDLFFGNAE